MASPEKNKALASLFTRTSRLELMSTRLCLFPRGHCLSSFCSEIFFRIVLHKRSLFLPLLALIESKNIFTLYNNTNCSHCLKRTEKDSLLGVLVFEVKGYRKRRLTFMGTQSILGTPLFSADVFQWVRFCNDSYDRSRYVVQLQDGFNQVIGRSMTPLF